MFHRWGTDEVAIQRLSPQPAAEVASLASICALVATFPQTVADWSHGAPHEAAATLPARLSRE